jgi:hypothetical protein
LLDQVGQLIAAKLVGQVNFGIVLQDIVLRNVQAHVEFSKRKVKNETD